MAAVETAGRRGLAGDWQDAAPMEGAGGLGLAGDWQVVAIVERLAEGGVVLLNEQWATGSRMNNAVLLNFLFIKNPEIKM